MRTFRSGRSGFTCLKSNVSLLPSARNLSIRLEVNTCKLTVIVSSLFNAIADCSALHASLLPNGQPSSFPFMDSMEDNEDAWEDADEDDDAIVADADLEAGEGEDEGGEAGRIRSDFHSGGGPGARFRPY